jgi:cytochrome c peroxidase
MSCGSCHLPSFYGSNSLNSCVGARRQPCGRNVPTTLNAALTFANNWLGNRVNIEDQATQGLTNPVGSGLDENAVVDRVKQIAGYEPLFRDAFPDDHQPLTLKNMGAAIGAWERTLLTPSRFDTFLAGDINALTERERRGLQKFMTTGCATCHNGVGIGGGFLRKFGVMEDYWKATGSAKVDDGLGALTKKSGDEYVFKVPLLRNIAAAAPYFHDGSVATLSEAVTVMARVQLNVRLEENDTLDIVAFLESLTGKMPADFVAVPLLPRGSVTLSK